ncbi:DUF1636 domain-containing protein [Sphingomonas sp. dw_22]|uniref:DUF1636 domain-containing protein n=1 Tax=Sphingomonas sp. dw_22 TaxID=2721175 RepID=UPI001BD3E52C|nr:DUF1636 domain-containing protein [Sphingomonas sp. dw_22]
MLRAAAPGPSVVVCNTCRHSSDAREDAEGVRGGARLAEAVRTLATSDPRYAGIAVEEMPCLFACAAFCTVHLRAPGRIGYVLGRFAPDAEAAAAILDFAVHHAASAHGQVPYRDWPQGVKGHFLVRIPPEGQIAT